MPYRLACLVDPFVKTAIWPFLQGFVFAQHLLEGLRLERIDTFFGCHSVSRSSAHLILADLTV